jgi:hypothetical protein
VQVPETTTPPHQPTASTPSPRVIIACHRPETSAAVGPEPRTPVALAGARPLFTHKASQRSLLVTTTLCATGHTVCTGLPPPNSHAYAALMQSLVTPSGKLLLRIFGPTISLAAYSCPSGWIATTLCYLGHSGPRWPGFLGIRQALMSFLSSRLLGGELRILQRCFVRPAHI